MPQTDSSHNEVLSNLPAALASATDQEVLNTAATALTGLYNDLAYIRVLLVSQHYTPSQLLELCADPRMAAAVAEVSHFSSARSTGSSGSTGGVAGQQDHPTSQQAAMRTGLPVFTPQLQQAQQGGGSSSSSPEGGPRHFADWCVLQQQFGLHSFAAVPLMLAGTVHGVIMVGATAPHTFTQGSMRRLRTVANMLSPYAALHYKYQQTQSTRRLLEQLLPPRVVSAALERLAIGGNSPADVFVPTHHDVSVSP